MDIDAARHQLEGMLRDLDGSARALRNEHAGDDGAELSHYDQHPADTATNLQDQDREEALFEVVSSQRQEVVEALARIDAGTYGRCVVCDRQLSDERLEARPEAARCVEDQAKAESR